MKLVKLVVIWVEGFAKLVDQTYTKWWTILMNLFYRKEHNLQENNQEDQVFATTSLLVDVMHT